MKEFVKQNWFKLSILLLIILLVGGYFYYYEIRPNKIKERCFVEAEFDSRAVFESNDDKRQEFISNYYENCIIRFGVK